MIEAIYVTPGVTSPLQEASIAYAKFLQEYVSKLGELDKEVLVKIIANSWGISNVPLDAIRGLNKHD